jgi:hypothetical protein
VAPLSTILPHFLKFLPNLVLAHTPSEGAPVTSQVQNVNTSVNPTCTHSPRPICFGAPRRRRSKTIPFTSSQYPHPIAGKAYQPNAQARHTNPNRRSAHP